MLLAAGRGTRMRPLTDFTPKPLLPVHGHALLDWHIAALLRDGVQRLVVNTAWLGTQIPDYLNTTWSHVIRKGLILGYSNEHDDFGHALETAGGISRALVQLPSVFWLVAGDVFAPDFVFDATVFDAFAHSNDLAHVWLVDNPTHNPEGDFGISSTGRALSFSVDSLQPRYTYSTIALLKAALFQSPWCDIAVGNPHGDVAPLAPLLRRAMDADRVGATYYAGRWTDVGTPERLEALNVEQPPLWATVPTGASPV